MAPFSWAGLIAICLSMVEQVCIIVAMLAFYHFFVGVVTSYWIVFRDYSSIFTSLVICQYMNETSRGIIPTQIASDIRISQLMRLDQFISYSVRPCNIQRIVICNVISIGVFSFLYLIYNVSGHQKTERVMRGQKRQSVSHRHAQGIALNILVVLEVNQFINRSVKTQFRVHVNSAIMPEGQPLEEVFFESVWSD